MRLRATRKLRVVTGAPRYQPQPRRAVRVARQRLHQIEHARAALQGGTEHRFAAHLRGQAVQTPEADDQLGVSLADLVSLERLTYKSARLSHLGQSLRQGLRHAAAVGKEHPS